MSGITMAFFGGATISPVFDPIPADSAYEFALSPSNASALIAFYSDGFGQSSQHPSADSTWQWHRQPAAGCGVGLYLRATLVSGVTPTGASLGVWLEMDVTRQFTVLQTSIGIRTSSLLLEISKLSGAQIIASRSVTITAFKDT